MDFQMKRMYLFFSIFADDILVQKLGEGILRGKNKKKLYNNKKTEFGECFSLKTLYKLGDLLSPEKLTN